MDNKVELKKPNDFIVNPLMSIHTELDDLNIQTQSLEGKVEANTKEIQEIKGIVSAILTATQGTYKELLARRPQGKVHRVNATAPSVPNDPAIAPGDRNFTGFSSGYYIIDANKVIEGHKFRAYTVWNPGPNNLYVGFNAATSPQVDVAPEDIMFDDKFDFLTPGQPTRDSFDTEEILSVHIRADPATGLGPQKFHFKALV